MRKHIHVHLHASTHDAEEGKWVTINGAHVMIGEGGKIVKGPAALVGKSGNVTPPPKKSTKADLHKAAREEHEKAKKGTGSFHHAAELYEGAGHKEKAAEAHALAKRYGHDPAGVARKRQADTDSAATARAQAKQAASSKARALLHEKADLHEKRAKGDPEDNVISARLRDLNDELAFTEKDDHKGQGDMDKMRAAIRKENPNITVNELNDEVDRRMPHATKEGITGLGESDLADKDRFNAGKDDPVHGGGGNVSDADLKKRADAMTPEQRAQRVKMLETRLDHTDVRAPLRVTTAITRELRSLGWGKDAPHKK